jgi:hypothetical protein
MCGAAGSVPDEWLIDRPDEEVSRPNSEDVRRTVGSVLASAVPLLGEAANA